MTSCIMQQYYNIFEKIDLKTLYLSLIFLSGKIEFKITSPPYASDPTI